MKHIEMLSDKLVDEVAAMSDAATESLYDELGFDSDPATRVQQIARRATGKYGMTLPAHVRMALDLSDELDTEDVPVAEAPVYKGHGISTTGGNQRSGLQSSRAALSSRYFLERQLGSGAMGEVWLAHDRMLDRRCAIKFLRPTLSSDENVRDRFLRECRLIGKLHHPNIVRTSDVMSDPPSRVMEYVAGTNLAGLINRGPLRNEQTLGICRDILTALEYAHSRHIVHRDVKPSNILIDSSRHERAYLVDFGVARRSGAVGKTDTIGGGYSYISPEQLQEPDRVDARSDIYSFGCVLYEMLTGKPPFAGPDDPFEARLVKHPVAPSQQNPRVPKRLDGVVMRCLQAQPDERFSSCRDLLTALEIAWQPAVTPRRETGVASYTNAVLNRLPLFRSLSRRRLFACGAFALSMVVLIAGVFLRNDRRDYPPLAMTPVLRLQGSDTIGDELAPALVEAYLRQTGGRDIRRVSTTSEAVFIQATMPDSTSPQVVEIQARGSSSAFRSLLANTCDIGMSSRKIRPDEVPALRSTEHVLGLDGVAIIVNKGNPVSSLTVEGVARIFAGQITNWSEVSGGPSRAIHVETRDNSSGTYDTFKSLLANRNISTAARTFADSRTLADAVARDPDAIGYVELPYVGGARALAIADSPKGPALAPTRETVAREEYALTRQLYLYAPSDDRNRLAKGFVDFAMSDAGQEVVNAAGFVTQTAGQAGVPPIDQSEDYRRITEGASRLSFNLHFDATGASLDTSISAEVERTLTALRRIDASRSKVAVLGFTDNVGSTMSNHRLSEERAQAVANKLSLRGVHVSKIRGFGEAMPLASNETAEGRSKNRRVEIWVSR